MVNKQYLIFTRKDAIRNFPKTKDNSKKLVYNPEKRLAAYTNFLKTGEGPRSYIKSWSAGRKPDIVKFLELLDEHIIEPGVLAVTTENPNFSLLNELCIRSIVHGGIAKEANHLQITQQKNIIQGLKKRVEKELYCKATIYPAEDPKKLRLDVNHVGRILYNMGAPAGKKRDNWKSWPEYLNYVDDECLRDFAQILFSNIYKSYESVVISLPLVNDRNTAKNLADTARCHLEYVIEDVLMKSNGVKSHDGFKPRIRMKKEDYYAALDQIIEQRVSF